MRGFSIVALVIGNCQSGVVARYLRLSGFEDVEYLPNTKRVSEDYDPAKVLERLAAAPFAIVQHIRNPENPLCAARLRKLNPNILITPYFFLDGVFSICSAPQTKRHLGLKPVRRLLRAEGVKTTLRRFRSGEIDFENAARLDETLTELKDREDECDVKIADFLRDRVRRRAIQHSHNHPTPVVFDEIARQLSKLLGKPLTRARQIEPERRHGIRLGRTPRVFSPHDVATLGLAYGPDRHWREAGERMIRQLSARLRAAEDQEAVSVAAATRALAQDLSATREGERLQDLARDALDGAADGTPEAAPIPAPHVLPQPREQRP